MATENGSNNDKKDTKYDERLHNKNFIQACSNAVNGIVYSATTQPNVKKELIIGTIILILSLFFSYTTTEFLALVFAVFFVIFAEMVNTAIETIVDLIVDVYHPKAKIAKDVAAGAVVLAAINAVIVAYFLFFKENQVTNFRTSILNALISSQTHLTFAGILIVLIAIVAIKAKCEEKKRKNGVDEVFIPSGQSMLAFAALTAIFMNTTNPMVFALSLLLALLVAGNRVNDKRTLGEVIFGAFMGVLIILMIYSLIFAKYI